MAAPSAGSCANGAGGRNGGPRTATVRADSDLDLLVLGQREFLSLLEEVPALSRKMLTTLAGQVRQLDDHLYG